MSGGDASSQVTQLSTSVDGLITKLNSLGDALKNFGTTGLKSGIDAASNFETKLFGASRALGQGVVLAKRMGDDLAKAGIQVLQMGGDLDDVIDSYKSINDALERTTFLTNKTLINIAAVSKFGVGGETITTIAKFFDKVGGGMEAAVERTIELTQTAQKYGLNAGKFVGEVASQMDKLNKYGFPKGVEDLASMVAKSKMLGDTLSVAQNFADQIMESPEKAYEYAAGLQTLGGSFAQLGDGAQLLYMAQNDLNGLQDQIVKATRGIATFNEETGQFQISTNERLRLRQLKNFGLDADKIEETALKLAKQEKIIQQLNFSPTKAFAALSDEEKVTLASYAQISKGGKITIEGKDIDQITPEKVNEILKSIQGAGAQLSTDVGKNVDVVQSNLSATERVTLTTNKLNSAYGVAILSVGKFSDKLNEIAGLATKPGQIAEGVMVEGAQKVDKIIEKGTEIAKIAIDAGVTLAEEAIKKVLPNYNASGNAGIKDQVTVAGAVNVKIEGFDLKLSKSIVEELEGFITKKVKEEFEKGYSK